MSATALDAAAFDELADALAALLASAWLAPHDARPPVADEPREDAAVTEDASCRAD